MLYILMAPFVYTLFADIWSIDAFTIWRSGDILGGAVILLICAVTFVPSIVLYNCLYLQVYSPKLSLAVRLIIEVIGLSFLIYPSLKSIIATFALPESIDGTDFFITSLPAVVGLTGIMISGCAFVGANWYYRSK
ncbi:hypothetical protein FJZ31_23010 [Candidatus Poribacteria bacterium]|nr:hypothetical protein [Candidatus Poribacteria bacterium]